MSFCVSKGEAFVGLRDRLNGQRQVVYDEASGKRVILTIADPEARTSAIEDALREGLTRRNILGGVIAALKSRHISIEYA